MIAETAVSIVPWPLILAMDHLEELEPVEFAALQPDVENDERRPALAYSVHRLGAVVRAARGVALVFKDTGNQCADVALVVDDEDIVAHVSSIVR